MAGPHAAPKPLPESSATECALTAPRSGHLDRLGRPNGVRGGGHDHPASVFFRVRCEFLHSLDRTHLDGSDLPRI